MRLKPLPIIIGLISSVLILAILFVSISYFRYTSEGAVTSYIRDHAKDVAIACVDPTHPEAGFYHNAEEAYPLASTFKLVLLAAYADEVAAGKLSPDETISVKDLEAFYLPNTDGGALYRRLGLEQTDLPFSYLGLYLFMSNHETGQYAQEDISIDEARTEQARLEGLFASDPAWREAEVSFLGKQQNFAPVNIQMEVVNTYGMRGSAHDMTRIMLAVYGHNAEIAPAMQTVMRQHLEWPLRLNPDNGKEFKVLATKGGAWPGILTSAWYGEPVSGKTPHVLSILYRDMPDDIWSAWLVSFSQQVLEARVLSDADCGILADAVK